MTPSEAADLAERTLAAIDRWDGSHDNGHEQYAADRDRVASDLAGLREHFDWNALGVCGSSTHGPLMSMTKHPCPDARRYADGLRRTAALYGVA